MASIVAIGLVVGALAAAWWSVTQVEPATPPGVVAETRDTTRDADGWTHRGWSVSSDTPWASSMVRVTTDRCGDEIRGSGVIVDGVVLTNRHVIEGAQSVVVTLSDGAVLAVDAVGASSEVDLARLLIPGLPRGLGLASERAPLDDDYALAGFPSGHGFTTEAVSIVAEERGWGFPDPDRLLRIDRTVVPGESGSAIVDARGDVAAMVYARANDDGSGLAIDAAEVRTGAARLVDQPFVLC